MSKSFVTMIVSRCLAGALGGVWACTKVMTAELSHKSNQSRAFQGNIVRQRLLPLSLHLNGFPACLPSWPNSRSSTRGPFGPPREEFPAFPAQILVRLSFFLTLFRSRRVYNHICSTGIHLSGRGKWNHHLRRQMALIRCWHSDLEKEEGPCSPRFIRFNTTIDR